MVKNPSTEAEAAEPNAKRARTWDTHDGVVVKAFGDEAPADVVLAFDMDGCLIATKSGAKHPKTADDWKLWHPTIPTVLKKKIDEKSVYVRVVIFTNQRGVSKGKTAISDITNKIDVLVSQLKVTSAVAFILTGQNFFRKPSTGAWDMFCEKYNNGVTPKLEECVFVGDAAGRPKLGKRKADFGNSDLKFALNIGMPFMTPEQFFFKESAESQKIPQSFAFDPRTLGAAKPMDFGPVSELEILLLVGAPGSGKSTLAKTVFPSYERVNRDTLKTKEKCIQAVESALKEKRNVVIDNQNVSVVDRKPYIEIAAKHGAKVRMVVFDVPKDYCFHANTYRKNLNPEIQQVPPMVIHSYYKNLQKPTKEECSEIFTYTLENLQILPGHEKLRTFVDS